MSLIFPTVMLFLATITFVTIVVVMWFTTYNTFLFFDFVVYIHINLLLDENHIIGRNERWFRFIIPIR